MTRISPEQARELLTGGEPGPWELIGEYQDGEPRPDESYLIHTRGGKHMGIMHGKDAALTAAAPDLAETIAGMTYEYTVYVYLGEKHIIQWSFEEDSHVGDWTGDLDKAEYVRDSLAKEGRRARVVRRLVSYPEVVE